VVSELPRRVTLAAIVLTIGTGGTDVTSFTRLGGVFTSVMTANMVLLGLAVATTSGLLAAHTALSLAGYVLGVTIGGRVVAPRPPPGGDEETRGDDGPGGGVGPRGGAGPGDRVAARAQAWPASVTVAFGLELVLLAGLTAGWELTGGHPAGAGQYVLLAVAAAAMGLQSAAVRALGAGSFSTTYVTGQLTEIVMGLVTPGKPAWPGWHRVGPLPALLTGALLGWVLIANAPGALPVITFVPLCLVVASALRPLRRADVAR
jgi:uncharacterized membrane protein YoaK (UPF0700 family)